MGYPLIANAQPILPAINSDWEGYRGARSAGHARNRGLAGTWEPKDRWERQAGRIYSTSLRLMMLVVHYRHMPLYRVVNQ